MDTYLGGCYRRDGSISLGDIVKSPRRARKAKLQKEIDKLEDGYVSTEEFEILKISVKELKFTMRELVRRSCAGEDI